MWLVRKTLKGSPDFVQPHLLVYSKTVTIEHLRRSATNTLQHCKCIIVNTTRLNSSAHKRGDCEQSEATRDNRCTERGRSHITGLWYSCHHRKGSNPLDEMWNWKGLKPITRLQVLPGSRVKTWFTPLIVKRGLCESNHQGTRLKN